MSDQVTFDEAQQALVDKLVGEARIKAREKAEADVKAGQEEAARTAEQDRLASEKDWQKLLELSQARVSALEPFEAQAKAYTAMVGGLLTDKIKALGDAAKKAVNALPETLSITEKLAWLTANEGLFLATVAPHGTPTRTLKSTSGETSPKHGCRTPLKL